MRCSLICCLVVYVVLCLRSLNAADRDFAPLLAGDDPDQLMVVGLKKDAVTIRDGEIRLGGPDHGYVATGESYRNYVLQFDWMYEPHHAQPADGNSGLLVHIQGPPKVWPRSLEVQVWYKDFGSFYTLGGGRFNPQKDDWAARDKVIQPPGTWNSQEVICSGGTITVKLNGIEYASGLGAEPSEGQIGWMFEGSPIRFRNVRIKKSE
jgi:hypothetical protein